MHSLLWRRAIACAAVCGALAVPGLAAAQEAETPSGLLLSPSSFHVGEQPGGLGFFVQDGTYADGAVLTLKDAAGSDVQAPISLQCDNGGFQEPSTEEPTATPTATASPSATPTATPAACSWGSFPLTLELAVGAYTVSLGTTVGTSAATLQVLPPPVCLDPAPLSTRAGSLQNGGFETGDLTGWTTGRVTDSVTVVSQDDLATGTVTPYEGNHMVRLGTAATSTANTSQVPGPNELCQDIDVASGATDLRFAYNVYTYDYTGFDDFTFQVRVVDAADGDVLAQVQQGAFGPGGDTSLKTSGWRGIEVDLSPYVGSRVRVYISAGGTRDSAYAFWTYLDSALGELPKQTVPVADVVAPDSATEYTNPQDGTKIIAMPQGQAEDVEFKVNLTCDSGTPTNPALVVDGKGQFPLTPVAEGSSVYSAVVPFTPGQGGGNYTVFAAYGCDSGSVSTKLGTITLYDPSGFITDKNTGAAVVGATVTLFKVPGFVPSTVPAGQPVPDGECETPANRGDSYDQPARTDLGVQVPAASPGIRPNVNPQSTNAVGRYGWDVAQGCYYVTVQKEGYVALTSPMVGVPPEVTDLDLAITPLPAPSAGGSGSGGGGGGSVALPPASPTASPTSSPTASASPSGQPTTSPSPSPSAPTTAPGTSAPTTAPGTSAPTTAPSTTAPSTTTTTAPPVAPACDALALRAPARVRAGTPVEVLVAGRPGVTVQVKGYAAPATRVTTLRQGRLGQSGTLTFTLRPSGSMRLFAQPVGCPQPKGSLVVTSVGGTTLTARSNRATAVFSGRAVPALAGRKVLVYRVAGDQRILVTQTVTRAGGAWSVARTFTGKGRHVFVATVVGDRVAAAAHSTGKAVVLR